MLNENHLILQLETEEMGKVVRYYKEQITTTEKIMILEIVSKKVIMFMYFKMYILNSK